MPPRHSEGPSRDEPRRTVEGHHVRRDARHTSGEYKSEPGSLKPQPKPDELAWREAMTGEFNETAAESAERINKQEPQPGDPEGN